MFVRMTVDTFDLEKNERGSLDYSNQRQVMCLTLDASQQHFNERMTAALRVALDYKEPFVADKLID